VPREVDLSFARYVERSKNARSARVREGVLYAYNQDERLRAGLGRVRPVTLASEAALRTFVNKSLPKLRAGGAAVGSEKHPALLEPGAAAAQALGLPPLDICVSPDDAIRDVVALGAPRRPVVFLPEAVVRHFEDAGDLGALRALMGSGYGCVHNQQVLWLTTLFELETQPSGLLRWVVKPAAAALHSWARRAVITTDRAALLAARDFAAAARTLVVRALHGPGGLELSPTGTPDSAKLNPDAWVELAFSAKTDATLPMDLEPRTWSALRWRLQALKLFEQTHYYCSGLSDSGASDTGGGDLPTTDDDSGSLSGDDRGPLLSLATCDAQVAELVSRVAP